MRHPLTTISISISFLTRFFLFSEILFFRYMYIKQINSAMEVNEGSSSRSRIALMVVLSGCLGSMGGCSCTAIRESHCRMACGTESLCFDGTALALWSKVSSKSMCMVVVFAFFIMLPRKIISPNSPTPSDTPPASPSRTLANIFPSYPELSFPDHYPYGTHVAR
uniref:Uncharacterized protein n=1 Tax=Candidatus Kentrum sp. TUN TaxID=2126343 RepID=A0A451A3E7_9GAMM|nr:MAG: hypothetical protein BECKTUN1418D_GA0071000_11281 [Candidatus Kentron sp. TUN]